MKDNRTGQICENCCSHIITYREDNKIIVECSYCGLVPENINPRFIDLEDDEYEQ
jgi:Zn ribbon nucleic-acid-binding protein